MTWDAYHHRDEILRSVLAEADARRDGTLPTDLPGVAETFGGELDLLAALQMRWHTRLAGTIESELLDQPADPESAVKAAWRRTADDLPGIRAILDRCADAPASEAVQASIRKSRNKGWVLIATMAGRASTQDHRAATLGREIEQEARATAGLAA